MGGELHDGEQARVTAYLHGRVQGVGMRWWVRCRALECGLSGAATNLPDGRVEVVAEGPVAAVATFAEILAAHEGAPGAITTVICRTGPATGTYTGFVERSR
jgi:acylphosphatase